MEIIVHRINSIELLKNTPIEYGVEIDIRSNNSKLILHHEPFLEGVVFEDWLSEYNHKNLILNIKEEGLEKKILELMNEYGINEFFFLDQSFPFLINLLNSGEKRTSIRLSEFESIETILNLKKSPNWIWVDFFSYFPLNDEKLKLLKNCGYRLCIVSPELQGYNANTSIPKLKKMIDSFSFNIDAVCTKFPEYWN